MSALFRSASTTAFDKLYRRHAPAVYRYARAVLGNHADAEDVAQQTFLNAYRALAQGTKPRKTENWLFTIAHNEVRRHLRDTRAKRLHVELDEELARAEPEQPQPSVSDVLRALQELTPNQRSALVMREFEGRSYAEIAEIMGVSQTALETLIFRARRSLTEALEDGLTCAEAELAVSRRLDGRLSRREARRLKAHMHECRVCIGFERRQLRQRSLLKGLSVIPVPASLFVFRGESAAAAAGGLGVGAAATGGSVGVAAKAAAVVAAVTVAGGVGYTAGSEPLAVPAAKATAEHAAGRTPTRSRVAAMPVLRRPRADRAAPASANADRVKPRRKGAQVKAEQPNKPKRKAAPPKAGRALTEAPHNGAPPAEKAAHPLKAKPAKAITKQASPAKARPAKPSPPKASPAKGRPAKVRPAKVRPAKATPARPDAQLHPTPPKAARPVNVPHGRNVTPAPATPAPAVPPGQEKQLLDPPKPARPENTNP